MHDNGTKEEIRSRSDIVDIIGTYVPLKRGGSTFKGLCPFHKEKTPSFNVDPRRQIYHCFGCGQGGDVFAFIMSIEGVDFITAMKLLASKCGVIFETHAPRPNKDGVDKELLYRIHEELGKLYHKNLCTLPNAKEAQEYVKGRKLSGQTIKDFLLGYAEDSPDAIITWGAEQGYTNKQLEAAGVIFNTDEDNPDSTSYKDRFIDRLLFPIRDELGRIIGFSGRVLPGNNHPAKYLNSPETMIFKKSRILFALDAARQSIVEKKVAILCEGQIDTIRCHDAGVTNAVAAQGTAVTEEHARMLKRYADEVILVLDSDTAGENAAIRSTESFYAAGLSVRAVALPEGEDPDTIILGQGAEAFNEMIENAQAFVDYQIDILSKREDPDSEAGAMRIARQVMETVSRADSAIQRDRLIQHAAKRLGIPEEAFRADLQKVPKPRTSPQQGQGRSHLNVHEAPPLPPIATYPPQEIALLELLCNYPETAKVVSEFLPVSALTDEVCRQIVQVYYEHAGQESIELMTKLDTSNPECNRLAAQIQMKFRTLGKEIATPEEVAKELALKIRKSELERQKKTLLEQMKTVGMDEQEVILVTTNQLSVAISTLDTAIKGRDWEAALDVLDMFDE
jgi:DNA primase